jgi:hypothetical protein
MWEVKAYHERDKLETIRVSGDGTCVVDGGVMGPTKWWHRQKLGFLVPMPGFALFRLEARLVACLREGGMDEMTR